MGVVVSLAEVRGPTKIFSELVDLAWDINGYEFEQGIPRGKLLVFNELLQQEIEADSCRLNLTKWMEVAKRLQPELNFDGISRPNNLVVRLALTSHRCAGTRLVKFPHDDEAYHKFKRLCTVLASCRLH